MNANAQAKAFHLSFMDQLLNFWKFIHVVILPEIVKHFETLVEDVSSQIGIDEELVAIGFLSTLTFVLFFLLGNLCSCVGLTVSRIFKFFFFVVPSSIFAAHLFVLFVNDKVIESQVQNIVNLEPRLFNNSTATFVTNSLKEWKSFAMFNVRKASLTTGLDTEIILSLLIFVSLVILLNFGRAVFLTGGKRSTKKSNKKQRQKKSNLTCMEWCNCGLLFPAVRGLILALGLFEIFHNVPEFYRNSHIPTFAENSPLLPDLIMHPEVIPLWCVFLCFLGLIRVSFSAQPSKSHWFVCFTVHCFETFLFWTWATSPRFLGKDTIVDMALSVLQMDSRKGNPISNITLLYGPPVLCLLLLVVFPAVYRKSLN